MKSGISEQFDTMCMGTAIERKKNWVCVLGYTRTLWIVLIVKEIRLKSTHSQSRIFNSLVGSPNWRLIHAEICHVKGNVFHMH